MSSSAILSMRGEHAASEAEQEVSNVFSSNVDDRVAWKNDIEFCSSNETGKHDRKVLSDRNLEK